VGAGGFYGFAGGSADVWVVIAASCAQEFSAIVGFLLLRVSAGVLYRLLVWNA